MDSHEFALFGNAMIHKLTFLCIKQTTDWVTYWDVETTIVVIKPVIAHKNPKHTYMHVDNFLYLRFKHDTH